MPPEALDPDALRGLDALLQTTATLLQQLQGLVDDIHRHPSSSSSATVPPSSSLPPDPGNALSLAADAATVIRAHATKISLLLINEPFSAAAVARLVRELVSAPVPALLSAAEACAASRYSALLRSELALRSRRLLSALGTLLRTVPLDGKPLPVDARVAYTPGDPGSIPATALLWNACDQLITLSRSGLGPFLVDRVSLGRDMLDDVLTELKEWGEEEASEEDGGDEDASEVDGGDKDASLDHFQEAHDAPGQESASYSIAAQAAVDAFMGSQAPIPHPDTDGIRPRLQSCLKKLRLVILFHEALRKHRLDKLPALPSLSDAQDHSLPSRIDGIAEALHLLPPRFEDLAAAFYGLDPQEIDETAASCFQAASDAALLLSQDWRGNEDSFGQWLDKFRAQLGDEN